MSIKYPIFHTGKGHLMFFHGWEPKKTQNGKELFRACLETHLSIMKRFNSMLAMAI